MAKKILAKHPYLMTYCMHAKLAKRANLLSLVPFIRLLKAKTHLSRRIDCILA